MTQDLSYLTIAEAARLVRTRKLSPVDLTESLLERIQALDPFVHAFITVTADTARSQARAAEAAVMAGSARGPLHGIPIGLKDVINTAGILTSGNCRVFLRNIPNEDAACATRLRDTGAVLMGKLTTHELAHAGPSCDAPWPPTRNPWSYAHFAGGSSSGSGAAVAAGFVLGSVGTDAGGSIRAPAGLCGIAGLMPTFGLVSREGIMPGTFTVDHCGPLARTAEDCALLLQSLAGYDRRDPASVQCRVPDYSALLGESIKGKRIGVVRHFWAEDLEPNEQVCTAMDRAIETFADMGARLSDVRLRPLQAYTDVRILITEPEFYSVHQRALRVAPEQFTTDFLFKVLSSCLFHPDDYIRAKQERRVMQSELTSLWNDYDALLTAGVGPAKRLRSYSTNDAYWKPNLHTPFTLMRVPVLSLCGGFSEDGLPLSLQIVGQPFREDALLQIGHAYERASPWYTMRPTLAPVSLEDQESSVAAPVPADKSDARLAGLVTAQLETAGIELSEPQWQALLRAAPYALGLLQRVRGIAM